MVEIIPKTQEAGSLFSRVLSFAALGVFGLAVLGFALLWFLNSSAKSQIADMDALLSRDKTKEERELESEVFLAKAQLQDLTRLLGEQKNALPSLEFLERVVHPDAVFLALNVNALQNSMQLQGRADTFEDLDEQLRVLRAQEEPESIALKNIQLAEEGGVNFQLDIQFSSTFFK